MLERPPQVLAVGVSALHHICGNHTRFLEPRKVPSLARATIACFKFLKRKEEGNAKQQRQTKPEVRNQLHIHGLLLIQDAVHLFGR
jgi:hypothetical protein